MANAGFDLEEVIGETMRRHVRREGCAFRRGAKERILASPEFAALAALVEGEEENCPEQEAV